MESRREKKICIQVYNTTVINVSINNRITMWSLNKLQILRHFNFFSYIYINIKIYKIYTFLKFNRNILILFILWEDCININLHVPKHYYLNILFFHSTYNAYFFCYCILCFVLLISCLLSLKDENLKEDKLNKLNIYIIEIMYIL